MANHQFCGSYFILTQAKRFWYFLLKTSLFSWLVIKPAPLKNVFLNLAADFASQQEMSNLLKPSKMF